MKPIVEKVGREEEKERQEHIFPKTVGFGKGYPRRAKPFLDARNNLADSDRVKQEVNRTENDKPCQIKFDVGEWLVGFGRAQALDQHKTSVQNKCSQYPLHEFRESGEPFHKLKNCNANVWILQELDRAYPPSAGIGKNDNREGNHLFLFSIFRYIIFALSGENASDRSPICAPKSKHIWFRRALSFCLGNCRCKLG